MHFEAYSNWLYFVYSRTIPGDVYIANIEDSEVSSMLLNYDPIYSCTMCEINLFK